MKCHCTVSPAKGRCACSGNRAGQPGLSPRGLLPEPAAFYDSMTGLDGDVARALNGLDPRLRRRRDAGRSRPSTDGRGGKKLRHSKGMRRRELAQAIAETELIILAGRGAAWTILRRRTSGDQDGARAGKSVLGSATSHEGESMTRKSGQQQRTDRAEATAPDPPPELTTSTPHRLTGADDREAGGPLLAEAGGHKHALRARRRYRDGGRASMRASPTCGDGEAGAIDEITSTDDTSGRRQVPVKQ